MPITLIHGNALGLISDTLTALKSNYIEGEIREFSGKNTEISNVLIEIYTPQLFSSKQLIVLDNFEDKVDISKLIADEETQIVFKFNKELTVANKLIQQMKEKKGKIFLFSEKDEKKVFMFLDYLVDRDKKSLLEFEKLYLSFGGQYIITMIFFQLRKFINPPKNLPRFVLEKMEKQKRYFTDKKIKESYKELLELDFKIKSGDIEDRVGLTLFISRLIS